MSSNVPRRRKHWRSWRRSYLSLNGALSMNESDLSTVYEIDQTRETVKKPVSFWWIFGFSSTRDHAMQAVGATASLASGTALPLMTIVLGSLTSIFTNAGRDYTDSEFQSKINQRALDFVYIAIGVAISTYIYTYCWILSGERTVRRIQTASIDAALSMPISQFDIETPGSIEARISSDIRCIREGISEKVGIILSSGSTFVTAIVIAFAQNWRLALVVCAILPAMVLFTGCTGLLLGRHSAERSRAEADAKGLAAHILSFPTVVRSLGSVDGLMELYERSLEVLRLPESQTVLWMAMMLGLIPVVLFSAYALAFWQGHEELLARRLDTGSVVTVLFAVLLAAFALGQGATHVKTLTMAKAAAQRIADHMNIGRHDNKRKTVKNTSRISSSYEMSQRGSDTEEGTIWFRNVHFAYPSRPAILNDFNLTIPAHSTTAIVGPTGSGKSSLLALLAGFYAPNSGEVLIDGIPVSDHDNNQLRSQMAFVMQDSQVLSATIFDNVAFGLLGTKMEHETISSKYKRVFAACDMANVTEFVDALPQRFETKLGKGGVNLSGGQQQRIAIARAIVREPRFLFLDEATASLDLYSEKLVSEALKKASRGRTVIMVAHRLNTIRDADSIVMLNAGRVVERGGHDEMMGRRSHYYNLIKALTACDEFAIQQQRKRLQRSLRRSIRRSKGLSKFDFTSFSLGSEEIDLELYDGSDYADTTSTHDRLPPRRPENATTVLIWLFSYPPFLESCRYLIPGVAASIINGSIFLLQALVFAHLIVLFADPSDPNFGRTVRHYCLLFVYIALGAMGSKFLSTYLLGTISSRTIARLRLKALQILLSKDLTWLSYNENNLPNLVDLAFDDCGRIAGAYGIALGIFVSVAANLISISILSLVLEWRLLAVVAVAIPSLLASGYVRAKVLGSLQARMQEEYTHASGTANEGFVAIRTIRAFQMEQYFSEMYCRTLALASQKAGKLVSSTAVLFAVSQSATYLINAFTIWYGATLIRKGHLDVFGFFACFVAVTFGAQEAGESFLHAPDSAGAIGAARKIKSLLMESAGNEQECGSRTSCDVSSSFAAPKLTFQNVSFAYPMHPDNSILHDISLVIESGQHIAVVGPSGSGKSSLIALIERFYPPTAGYIAVGSEIMSPSSPCPSPRDLEHYRHALGYVPQAPTLFPGTIGENILLALPRATLSSLSPQRREGLLKEVCTAACIHEFIASLPDGYHTRLEAGNATLSGGQKQRITLARSLVRDPAILLLDEATSALDRETERQVLQKLRMGRRTVVNVTHSASVAKEADCCFVVDRGRIVQRGKHDDLIQERNGVYRRLFGGEAI